MQYESPEPADAPSGAIVEGGAKPASQEEPIVVKVGASAGGLQALEAMFASMPLDTGLAFVVIQHLSPHYPSHMDDLLGAQDTPEDSARARWRSYHARHHLPPPSEKGNDHRRGTTQADRKG